MVNKEVILYFEDDVPISNIAKKQLKKAFPKYEIILNAGDGVSEVLNQIGGVERIVMVCTDGTLTSNLGWYVVKELKQKGYCGPALYTGARPLPEEEEYLYVGKAEKLGEELINAIKKYIKE